MTNKYFYYYLIAIVIFSIPFGVYRNRIQDLTIELDILKNKVKIIDNHLSRLQNETT